MFDLEKNSQKISTILFKNSDADELTKAKAEYGLSLLLGIFIELTFCLTIALFFGVFLEVLLLMTASLLVRVLTGGAHCTSYARCLIFTIFFYMFFSYLAKSIYLFLSANVLYSLSAIFLIIVMVLLKKYKSPLITKLVLSTGVILMVLWFFSSKPEYIFIINLGILLQSLMSTNLGGKIVENIDTLMIKIGI